MPKAKLKSKTTSNRTAKRRLRVQRVVRHGKRNLAWAERELMKMQDEETDPQLRALWSTAARIARERISHGKAVVPNGLHERPGATTRKDTNAK